MQKWEYLVAAQQQGQYLAEDEEGRQYVLGSYAKFRDTLNAAGEEGWELIQVVGEQEALIFKRLKGDSGHTFPETLQGESTR